MERNIAVVGCGYWGKNLVRNIAELGALHTICDSNPETLGELRESYPEVNSTTDCKDVLADTRIKAVMISTPTAMHYSMTKQALEAEKDVFTEKPLALTAKEGEGLVKLARKNKRILMVGHLLEYHPAVIKLKDLVSSGKLGKIDYIYSNRLNLGKFRTEEDILWSFAPHDISVILLLLGHMPIEVSCYGGNYLTPGIPDTTVTNMSFNNGTKAHIFVSWMHPYKEQRLVVIGDKKMAVFNDVAPENNLVVYDSKVKWDDDVPKPDKNGFTNIAFSKDEPLKLECQHFLNCIRDRTEPKTNGTSALRVLRVLEACHQSLTEGGTVVNISNDYFVHPTSIVEKPVSIGKGTKIWHFCHIMPKATIGKDCTIGQNVFIGGGVRIGKRVKLENNVSVFSGVSLEDDVFCGPSCVFTNVINPRSHISRKQEYKTTLVKKGGTIGANATIVCGHVIGENAFVGAGAVVTKDIPDYALVYGNPAVFHGWVCKCGEKLDFKAGKAYCSACKLEYMLNNNVASCLA